MKINEFFDKPFNPAMLRVAREARGLTQKELADCLSVEQGTISKIETSQYSVSDKLWDEIAVELKFPRAFFANQKHSFSAPTIHYRRLKQIPKKELYRAEAQNDLCRFGLQDLLHSVDIPVSNLMYWDVESYGSPEDAARKLRERWQVPKGPIDNLTLLLERNGVVIFELDIDPKITGLSHLSGQIQPIISVNKDLPADRLRFTLAHELGHLLMHFSDKPIDKDRNTEEEAHRFASEFLVPEAEVAIYLKKLDLRRLRELKKYWKVSMQMLLYRATKLQCIADHQYRSLKTKINQEGYRIHEPIEFPKEQPVLARTILQMHLTELGYTEESLADMLALPKDILDAFRGPETQPRLRIAI